MTSTNFNVTTFPPPPFASGTFTVTVTAPSGGAGSGSFHVDVTLPPRFLQMYVNGNLIPVQLGRYNGATIDWLSPGL